MRAWAQIWLAASLGMVNCLRQSQSQSWGPSPSPSPSQQWNDPIFFEEFMEADTEGVRDQSGRGISPVDSRA